MRLCYSLSLAYWAFGSQVHDLLQDAAKLGPSKLSELLLDPSFDPSAQNQHPIKWASMNGHEEFVYRLLQDSRVDPSDDGQHAIQLAAENGHVKVVDLLLTDDRVDPSANDQGAIR